ncbi:GAF and ANTAR domain-containing protein [Streptomyces kaniharaensis]|uniref:GAF and ANTAR domain-containing protein n=1 Tax=Streptomyces kaniharaensis TaxID=212423 RepID=A0A6N7L286_9ACTN|nr:GAF and ANTAR domain-containing protein [Streptomyces kaniharaensis]MQS16809.1 GAF and ANTAR domain-containing protein [Streptomyces kaniharaensis]
MADLTRIAQIMAEAVNGPGRPSLPERLCLACVEALTVEAAAITLMADTGHRAGVWASDGRARRMEERQFSLGEGPGVDAFRSRRPVSVADLLSPAEMRWPVLTVDLASAAPVHHGLRSVYVSPLHLGTSSIGVLSLYRSDPGVPGTEEVADIQVAATTVTLAIVGSFMGPSGDVPAQPWLDDPPLNGVEVDQAVGMIMVQLSVSATEALDRLRAHAFAQDQEIDQVARDVVRRRLRFTEEDR